MIYFTFTKFFPLLRDSTCLIEKLRNLPGVEEVKTEIVLDRIKEDHSIFIPE
ncbi:MAG: hypothetical protein V3V33_17135 [Candidatus Lokiarchaeia archaeon]